MVTERKARRRLNGDGTIYQEAKTGRWVGAITLDGRRRKVKAATRDEAATRLRELTRSAAAGIAPGDGNLTVGQLVELYEERHLTSRDRQRSTIDAQRWALRQITERLGKRRVRTLTVDQVEEALTVAASGDDPLARSSLVKIRSTLGQVLEFGERRQLVARNVARIAELPSTARRPEPGRSLTVAEARKFLEVAKGDKHEALWAIMLGIGLRPGEATGLLWSDVDHELGRINVRRALKTYGGSEFVLDDRLKTSRSRRAVDAPTFVLQALRAHKARQAADRLRAGNQWSEEWPDLVFTTALGTPLNPSNVRRELAKLTGSAGLGRWHPHELRHSCASILSAAGVPIEQIADALGHDGTRMTMLVYRHAVAPSVAAVADPMQNALG